MTLFLKLTKASLCLTNPRTFLLQEVGSPFGQKHSTNPKCTWSTDHMEDLLRAHDLLFKLLEGSFLPKNMGALQQDVAHRSLLFGNVHQKSSFFEIMKPLKPKYGRTRLSKRSLTSITPLALDQLSFCLPIPALDQSTLHYTKQKSLRQVPQLI